jgi:hypothetical protein
VFQVPTLATYYQTVASLYARVTTGVSSADIGYLLSNAFQFETALVQSFKCRLWLPTIKP